MKTGTHSFRTKLWLYFILFAALIFSLLWVMQTLGLQGFYDDMMKNNIRNAGKAIAAASGSENFFEIIDRLSFEDSLLVFITDEEGNLIYSSDSYNPYFRQLPRPFSERGSKNIPNRSNDRTVNQTGPFRNLPDNYDEFLKKVKESEFGIVEYTSGSSFIYGARIKFDVDVFEDFHFPGFQGKYNDDDNLEAILYTAGTLGAVGAAASIIRTQLLLGTGLSLILGFIIAWVISRRFSKPISQLTDQAKMLSEEHYEEKFQKGFCRELDELNDSLSQSAEKLSEARMYQKELLANVSHDLRTPLTMIKGYAEMVRDISWEDEAQRSADTGVIIKEADRMTALVNEILEYSRLHENNFAAELHDTDLSSLTETVTDRFDPLFSHEGGIIERDITPECIVKGNPELLERAVFNLLDNAVRHAAEPDKRIKISVHPDGDHICFEVRDFGKGIDPEELPHIWEKYYTSRQRGNKGVSGLGLAIVKQIAALHQAEISAESEPGKGTLFRLTFK
ncbi:MAG: HAMP domain-containing histidine kinase [Anaerolineaceae bacterium]|nr:HAMP domain-containing histidine kinase [Anaerolineaceae bacterium]